LHANLWICPEKNNKFALLTGAGREHSKVDFHQEDGVSYSSALPLQGIKSYQKIKMRCFISRYFVQHKYSK